MSRRRPARPTQERAGVPAELYSADLLETFAAGAYEAYIAAGGRPLRGRVARALALAGLRPGLVVVDVGCGRGEAAAHAARRGAWVTALDYSPGALKLSRRTLRAALGGGAMSESNAISESGAGIGVTSRVAHSPIVSGPIAPGPSRPEERAGELAGESVEPAWTARVRLVAADVTALPLADASADRVLLLDVVEHLHAWQLAQALGEARRILKPGGYVIIHTLPNRWALSATYPLLRLLAPRLPASPRSDYEHAVHVNEQDPRSLRRILASAGLHSRVWVEEWSTRQAAKGTGLDYPDRARQAGYPLLAQPWVRRLARQAMRSPWRDWVGNDIFALAWRSDGPEPPSGGRFQRLS